MAPTPATRIASTAAALANCLTAGAIFTFALWSPPLARALHLSSSQLNLLASSAILGEYATAAYWGSVADSYGPGIVSLAGGGLFGVGFGLLGWTCEVGVEMESQGKSLGKFTWVWMCAAYFLAGCGTAASYFAAVISSTKSAPTRHSGLAIAVPCAVFGLSPLFLSSLASLFTAPTTPASPSNFSQDVQDEELDAGRWLLFLAAFLAIVNGLGGLLLKELPWNEVSEAGDGVGKVLPPGHDGRDSGFAGSSSSSMLDSSASAVPSTELDIEATERTSLLRSSSTPTHPNQTLRDFVSTPTFWLFGAVIFLSTGPCEMFFASLGSVLESLLAVSTSTFTMFSPHAPTHALQLRKRHIALLSVANTLSRLIVGALSDYLATPTRADNQTRPILKKRVSRLVFLLGACLALSIAYGWAGTGMTSERGLWVVTIVTGVSYGTLFTLCPAIVRSCWPVEHFGRNWGLLTWFSALGALLFTPLFGILRDLAASSSFTPLFTSSNMAQGPACAGPACYRPVFLVCAVSAGLACGAIGLLRPRWGGLV
ncbi:hypothetical protein JCM21900_003262 [Sporobolomyces salmonicolor]